jgi:Arc/MetJ-type ribon-helix-helix transcriptional regulator
MKTVAFSLGGEHVATVRAYAKDGGYPSVSAALRRIIDEWVETKQFQALAQGVLRAQVAGAITAEEAVEALTARAGLILG